MISVKYKIDSVLNSWFQISGPKFSPKKTNWKGEVFLGVLNERRH